MSVTHSQPQSNEAELIKSVCGGEREAFYELVHPYERMIYATAISVVKNPADAEEVAQEAVLKAFSNLASFRAEAKFSTWILQITYNEAKMRLKKARSHLYESIDDSEPSEDADYWPQNATNSLGRIYREVFFLRDVQNLSTKETATILGISEGAVKIRLLRARLQMRDALAPGFDGCWFNGQPYQKVRPW
jgi:RNA polymerase sigma-70 factor, ECF subfamily